MTELTSTCRNRRQPRSTAGYTLFEVLVAVALAGLITGAAGTMIPRTIASFSLQNATFAVAQELRVARQRAITTRAKARIEFPSTTTYKRRRESPAGSNTYVDDGGVTTLPSGVTASSNPVNPTFDRRGLIANAYTVTLTDGSLTKTVTVTGIGRIDVN